MRSRSSRVDALVAVVQLDRVALEHAVTEVAPATLVVAAIGEVLAQVVPRWLTTRANAAASSDRAPEPTPL